MNERIKELQELATDECGLNPSRFAELIVRECADKAHEFIVGDGNQFPIKSVAYRIKQHFGVEV